MRSLNWRVPAVLLALLLYLLLGALSGSLGRIQVADLPARSLSGLHTTFAPAESTGQVRQAWCLWNTYQQNPVVINRAYSVAAEQLDSRAAACVKAFESGMRRQSASGDGTGARLVHWYVVLNLLLSALYLGLGLEFILGRCRTLDPESEIDAGLRKAAARVPLLLLFGGLAGVSVLESCAQWMLGDRTASLRLIDAAGVVLAGAPAVKTLLLGILMLLMLALVLHRFVEIRQQAEDPSQTSPSPGLALTPLAWLGGKRLRRTLGLLRIQLVVVAIFVLLLSGIGQDEMPDALLRWGDLDGGSTDRLLGLITLGAGLISVGALSLLLWCSASRVALTTSAVKPPVPPVLVTGVAGLCLIVALVWPRWPNLGGLGIVLAVIALLSTFSGAAFWRRREPMKASGYSQGRDATATRAALVEAEVRELVVRLAQWLAAAPVAVVGLALIRAALPPLVVRGSVAGDGMRFVLVILIGTALLALSTVVPGLLSQRDRALTAPNADGVRRPTLYVLLATGAGLAYVLAVLPMTRHGFPVLIGPVAVVALFLAAALAAGSELQRLAELSIPVAGLRVFGARRNPVLAILLAWFVLGSFLDAGGPHAVRVLRTGKPVPRASIAQSFTAWARANCALGGGAGADGVSSSDTSDLPMVFVAAEGGGIRAAYWTAAVLDSVFPMTTPTAPNSSPSNSSLSNSLPPACGQPRDRVFALSGASGDSVGMSFWLNAPQARRPWYQRVISDGHPPVWYDTALAVDHLSAVGSWMLYVDVPRTLLGYPGLDRAALLEQSWEISQPSLRNGFLAGYSALAQGRSAPWRPLALINGTAVESGCRALTAPVPLTDLDDPVVPGSLSCLRAPSTADGNRSDSTGLYDVTQLFLCPDEDVAGSTAALLSARFPYVTPSGRLTRCGQPNAHSYVVDGAYLDNSGDLSVTDLYIQLKPLIAAHNALVAKCAGPGGCPAVPAADRPTRRIRPVLIQLDNGYPDIAQRADASRPGELSVPPKARLAVAAAVEQSARQRAVEVFGTGAYLQIAPAPHPGVEAPLGWVMSDSARDDLCHQLHTVDLSRLATVAGVGSPQPRC